MPNVNYLESGSAGLVFISHSHIDREVAHSIKHALGFVGIDAFVAHEDIEPSDEWESSIQKNLKKCSGFLAIISRNFRESKWTDQEIGYALALRKVILSVKLNQAPYGFIAKYQAFEWRAGNPSWSEEKFVTSIARKLAKKGVLKIDPMIKSFTLSRNFDQAGNLASILFDIPAEQFNKLRARKIVEGAIANRQIHGSGSAYPFLTNFLQRESKFIDGKLSDDLKKKMSS